MSGSGLGSAVGVDRSGEEIHEYLDPLGLGAMPGQLVLGLPFGPGFRRVVERWGEVVGGGESSCRSDVAFEHRVGLPSWCAAFSWSGSLAPISLLAERGNRPQDGTSLVRKIGAQRRSPAVAAGKNGEEPGASQVRSQDHQGSAIDRRRVPSPRLA